MSVWPRAGFLATDDWLPALPVLLALRRRLAAIGFHTTAALPLPGNVLDLPLDVANARAFVRGRQNLFHHSALAGAYRRVLGHQNPEAVALHELLTLNRMLPRARVAELLSPRLLDELVDHGVFSEDEGIVESNIVAAVSGGRVYLADAPHLRDDPDYVYLGRSSFSPAGYLASIDWRPPRHSARAPRRMLDLGCGAGPAAVAAGAAGVEHVIGTDIVERCLRYARLNAALNGVDTTEFRYSDVLSAVEGDFDLIVSNAPCVWEELQQATFATGGADFGTALPVRMIREALGRLRPSGLMYVVMTAPIVDGDDYVVEAMRRACREHSVEVCIHPELAEYEVEQRSVLRRHKISSFIRYGVVIEFADRFSVSVGSSFDAMRYRTYGVRSRATRAAAALVRA